MLPPGEHKKGWEAKLMLFTRKWFRKDMIKVDKHLQMMASLSNAMLEKGPEKNDKRWINKARFHFARFPAFPPS